MLRNFHSHLLRVFTFLCLFVVLSTQVSFSQNETKKWYFGSAAGLDFVSGTPTMITTSSMAGYREGTSSVADAFGNLLFYTDGATVWDKTNQVMANGSGLFGSVITTQSALVVKKPGSATIYYVFTLGPQGSLSGLWYSTIDMSLAAGNGSVTVKNTLVHTPSCEKLTGTKHCNGTDIWVVSHDYNSANFRSILITASGVSSTATLTTIGSVWNTRYMSYGSAKISQNGKKLGCAFYNQSLPYGTFEVYDFNNATGVLSNPLTLPIPLYFPPQPIWTGQSPPPPRKLLSRPEVCFPYGCEFSPDASKFYGSGAGDLVFYQWDLCAGSAANITSSRYAITSFTSSALQLAKDGKIYVARLGHQTIGVINNPNLSGAACNYVAQGPSIAPALCSYGLPNFISQPPQSSFSVSINGAVSCNNVFFTLPSPPTITTTACASTGYSVTSFAWFFGDQSSGASNTSTLTNPSHLYPAQGIYTASLVYRYTNSCGGASTDTLKQEVKVGSPPLLSPMGFNICNGNSITLSLNGMQSYAWNEGSNASSIVVSPSITTTYTVSGTDAVGCPYVSYQTVEVYNSPTLTVKGPTVTCPNYQIKLTAYGANTYSWNTGSTTSVNLVIQTSTATTYTLSGITNGCVTKTTVTVLQKKPDVLISGGNVTVCPGTAVTLTASGTPIFAWSTGANTSTTTITPTKTMVYSVQGMDNKACTNTNSVTITVQTKTVAVDFTYPSPVCESTPTLAPVWAAGSDSSGKYSSFFFPVDSITGKVDLTSVGAGIYYVNYYLPKKACTDSATSVASVTVVSAVPLNLTPDLAITPGSSVALQVSGGINYNWSPAAYLSCTNCAEPVASPPENTTYCVVSDSGSCVSKACVTISVTCETKNDYSMPNAFTPNGDGINDQYCLKGWSACLNSFHIMIYDRWGEKVFESSDPDFCWDGFYKNVALASDVFVYVVNIKKTDGSTLDKSGNIHLIR
ncbi:hypothetical protein CNR22_11340 [Sphingobacteriaceae bacterium]|nr:hypothetical protein CNR22_11340 [Sphingobacteriaceae bacterium]